MKKERSRSTAIISGIIAIIVSVIVLTLYIIIASRILPSLISKGGNYYSATGQVQFETFKGFVTTLFVLILPSLLIALFIYKRIKRLGFWKREKATSTIYQGEARVEDSSVKEEDSSMTEEPVNPAKDRAFIAAKIWFQRGHHLYEEARYKDAAKAFNNSIKFLPSSNALYCRAVACQKLGMNEQVIKDLKIAARMGHQKAQRILTSKGIEYRKP